MTKKKNKLEKLMPLVVLTGLLSLAVACGSNNDDDDDNVAPLPQEETTLDGSYTLSLSPLNSSLFTNSPTGEGKFEIDGDDFSVMIKMRDSMKATHMQYVYSGTTCPTAAADTNGDGIIDGVEANAVVGGILIPLDSNLKMRKNGLFPYGSNYNYKQSTSLLAMTAEMRLSLEGENSPYVTLGADEELNLIGRVVIIHGVPTSTNLPTTVQGTSMAESKKTLPIACGVLTKAPDVTPEPTPAPGPSPAPEPTPTPTPTPTPSPQPTPLPVPTPTPTPTPTPSPQPTPLPVPSPIS